MGDFIEEVEQMAKKIPNIKGCIDCPRRKENPGYDPICTNIETWGKNLGGWDITLIPFWCKLPDDDSGSLVQNIKDLEEQLDRQKKITEEFSDRLSFIDADGNTD